MMNTIVRSIVGGAVGYAMSKYFDTVAFTEDKRQPIEKAAAMPLFKLANENSIAWFQAKLQDAVDMINDSVYGPKERVLITNATAREFRIACLKSVPEKDVTGKVVCKTKCDIPGVRARIYDEKLDCAYRLTLSVEFKRLGGVVIPVVYLSDKTVSDKEWSSFREAFYELHEVTEKAINIAKSKGMLTQDQAEKIYGIGKEIGKGHKVSDDVAEFINKAPVVKMSEM